MSQSSNPDRIEGNLNETRSRLDRHLSELENRLSPGQILDDLMAYFRGSEGAAIGQNLVDSIRHNPLPAAVTGIGLAWLMSVNPRPEAGADRAQFQHFGRDDHEAMMVRLRDAETSVVRPDGETEETYSERLDEARGRALGLARHADESASSFARRVGDALAVAKDTVADKAQGARDMLSRAAGTAGASAQGAWHRASSSASSALSFGGQTSSQLASAIAESPVVLGALGVVAGALLGTLVPQSEQEERALGGIASQARGTVSGLAQEGMERGRHVAEAVTQTARDSAERHGLKGDQTAGQVLDSALSGDLARDAKNVAQETLQAGHEALGEEVGSASSSRPAAGTSSRRA